MGAELLMVYFLQTQKGFLDDFGFEEFFTGSLVDGPSGLKDIAPIFRTGVDVVEN